MHADDVPSTATDSHPSHAFLASPSPVAPNDHGPLRRLKSKSSLWSLASSTTTTAPEDDVASEEDKSRLRPSILRRLSPALAARVKLLDGGNKASASRNASTVGRIPEAHLKELDSLHQDLSIRVERKGQAWAGLTLTSTSPEQHQNASSTSQQHDRSRYDPGQRLEHTDVAVVGSALSDLTTAHTECPDLSPSSSMSVAEPAPAQLRADPDTAEPRSSGTSQDKTDFEKYVEDTARKEEGGAPIPPPKDSPRTYSLSSSSQFNPRGLQRTESIYSFSRASFSNQLSQLTSIPLPQPSSLEANIASIPTALAAVRGLNGAAEQIMIWIKKASDVLNGLDAEDDVEWAAAGGREGLESVDKAVTRFESLVNVYVAAIENVQLREDIATVDSENLQAIVGQMESILQNWSQIKDKLQGVKDQVELAMEWEELWSNVLGDVGMEIENLSGLIFEMEEKRHETLNDPAGLNGGGLDINELETIVEESPVKGRSPLSTRLSIGPVLAAASGTPIIKTPQDDSSHSNLMAIFARMQPLRASLDFLPMRLSMFQSRADSIFPSACEELEDRRSHLEKSYKELQTDAESLRKELGEDKWILVFRNAGSQAQKMFDSVERSIGKLQEGIETGLQLHSPSTLTKRMENYEAKKQHYVPAIERVIGIIQKGVKDRLTVNGEILRLLSDMTSRTDALKASIRVMDASLEDVQIVKGQQLRDSISSIITMDSPVMGSAIETPGSSPASSVILAGNGHKGVSTPHGGSSRRDSSVGSSTGRLSLSSKVRRYSGLPQGTSSTLAGRKSSIPQRSGAGSPTPSNARGSYTPTPASRKSSRPSAPSPLNNRPRWNNSTNTNDLNKGYSYKPLCATTPSASSRKSSAPAHLSRPSSTIPLPSPFRRDISASPAPGHSRSISRVSNRQSSRSPAPMRDISPRAPSGNSSLLDPPPYSRLRRPSGLFNSPRSRQSFGGLGSSFSRSVSQNQDPSETPSKSNRPGTSLGHSANRRISLLPLPKHRQQEKEKERTAAQSRLDSRPPFRV
ncbi:hypothetical protein N7510_003874 [Penicillium lagena]|uniref:uncharacterized protein n=1 Tax=Penicillium lagena TaxID=94218 RepID=UPI0025403E10|nr:uncharacterized protein N7510_003874 [Penicillium lagena]KAJ5619890.1 hypothetical protein N7510_003874 [Penicillium lagena]